MPLEELIGELGCSKIQGRRIINYLSEVVHAPENHAMTVTSPMHTALETEAIQLEKDAKDQALSEVTVSMEKTEEGKGLEEICIDSVKVHIMSGVPLTLFFVCARVLFLSLLSFFSFSFFVFLFLSFLFSLSCIQTHTHTHMHARTTRTSYQVPDSRRLLIDASTYTLQFSTAAAVSSMHLFDFLGTPFKEVSERSETVQRQEKRKP